MDDLGNIMMAIWPWLFILGLMYLLFIRPQQKRDRERRQMLEELRVGDRVVTIGGIHGTIRALREGVLTLEVSEDLSLTMSREAIAGTRDEMEDQPAG